MNKTLLAVDIGNTTITCGLFRGSRLLRRFAWPTRDVGRFSVPLAAFDDCIIASVVPAAGRTVANFFSRRFSLEPLIVGKGLRVPVINRYRTPGQVGPDRLINAYAAIKLYGAPAVVVDFGTAVTFDVVSRKKEYIGGMIFPGLRMSLDALHEKTALLPRVALHKPSMLIGRSTRDSIMAGLVYGYAALTDALVAVIKRKIGKGAFVIATGGNAGFLKTYCRVFDAVDVDLTLQGLRLTYEYYAQGKTP
jgi:type III pantothenate kinase